MVAVLASLMLGQMYCNDLSPDSRVLCNRLAGISEKLDEQAKRLDLIKASQDQLAIESAVNRQITADLSSRVVRVESAHEVLRKETSESQKDLTELIVLIGLGMGVGTGVTQSGIAHFRNRKQRRAAHENS